MAVTPGKKVFGFDTDQRDKISPSRTAGRARTESEQSEFTKAAATKVIRIHKKALISLRNK